MWQVHGSWYAPAHARAKTCYRVLGHHIGGDNDWVFSERVLALSQRLVAEYEPNFNEDADAEAEAEAEAEFEAKAKAEAEEEKNNEK